VPFGGRTREIDALNGWLHDRRDDGDADVLAGEPASNNLLITAPAGRGKTALLVRWIEQLPADWPRVFVPVSIRYQTNQALTFYQALAAGLANILGEKLSEPRTDPTAYYREKVIEHLDHIAKSPSQDFLKDYRAFAT
jgi:ATP/maltotriose-dependent transcriptional regulator MalT